MKKGAKSCPVIYFKQLEIRDKDTEEVKRIPLLRYYSIFNVAQVEGIEFQSVTPPVRQHTPIQAAEAIVAGMPKRPEIKNGMAKAFYSPTEDYVGIPAPEQFRTGEDYYSVLFHELTHSTSHPTRLNRKGVNGTHGNWSAFGTDPYAKEELVAEFGAAFLCAECGISRTLENSAAYLASWVQRFKEDSKLVVQAASLAQRSTDWILGRLQGSEQNGEAN